MTNLKNKMIGGVQPKLLVYLDENGNMVFQYFGKHLGVSKDLFSNLHGLFSHMNVSETEKLIQLWFEKKYPNEPVQAVYYSIYF